MKNKVLMLLVVAVVALGLSGCMSGAPSAPLSESGQTKYVDYSAEKIAKIRGKKKFIVFFHADWCGTCKAWQKKVVSIAPELPADAIILKANYDNEKELVKSLGIKSQSTAVFFGKDGKALETIIDPSMDKVKEFFAETVETKTMNDKKEKMDNSANKELEKEEIAETIENPAKYIDYSVENRQALAGKKHLIFFYANWCGTCKAWDKKLKNGLANMPAGTAILKADYDNDTELKKEFGIASQSTAVFINADGSVAKKVIDPKMEEVTEFFAN